MYVYSGPSLYIGCNTPNGHYSTYAPMSHLDTSEWFHCAGVFDDAARQWRVHINGSLARTYQGSGPERMNGPWTLGAAVNSNTFAGYMAEAKIWNVARTEVFHLTFIIPMPYSFNRCA